MTVPRIMPHLSLANGGVPSQSARHAPKLSASESPRFDARAFARELRGSMHASRRQGQMAGYEMDPAREHANHGSRRPSATSANHDETPVKQSHSRDSADHDRTENRRQGDAERSTAASADRQRSNDESTNDDASTREQDNTSVAEATEEQSTNASNAADESGGSSSNTNGNDNANADGDGEKQQQQDKAESNAAVAAAVVSASTGQAAEGTKQTGGKHTTASPANGPGGIKIAGQVDQPQVAVTASSEGAQTSGSDSQTSNQNGDAPSSKAAQLAQVAIAKPAATGANPAVSQMTEGLQQVPTSDSGATSSIRANATAPGTSPGTGSAPTGQPDDVNTARLTRGLQNAVQQRGGGVTLRLTPPEMGTVRIQLQIQAGTVNAQFHTETESARQMLQQQFSQLRQALEGQGLSVDRLNVQTMSSAQQSSSQQAQTGQQGTPQQQADASPNDGRSRGEYGRQGDQSETGDANDMDDEAEARQTIFERLLNEVG